MASIAKSNLTVFLGAQGAFFVLGLYALWLASNDALYWLLVAPVPFKVMLELGKARVMYMAQKKGTFNIVSVLGVL